MDGARTKWNRTGLAHRTVLSQSPQGGRALSRPSFVQFVAIDGKVNIFNLAKNAGTSVEQIERFYAKHLPLSREMAKNLQSFGEG